MSLILFYIRHVLLTAFFAVSFCATANALFEVTDDFGLGNIVGMSCDATKKISEDGDLIAGKYLTSCEGALDAGTPVTIDNFRVWVEYHPFGNWNWRQTKSLRLGDSTLMTLATFSFVLEGDKGCVYARELGFIGGKVTRYDQTKSVSDIDLFEVSKGDWASSAYESGSSPSVVHRNSFRVRNPQDVYSGIPPHCVPIPQPRQITTSPVWSSLIARACTDYCGSYMVNGVTGKPVKIIGKDGNNLGDSALVAFSSSDIDGDPTRVLVNGASFTIAFKQKSSSYTYTDPCTGGVGSGSYDKMILEVRDGSNNIINPSCSGGSSYSYSHPDGEKLHLSAYQEASTTGALVPYDFSNIVALKSCAAKHKHPFMGVVVQCVQDTINNILFYGVDPNSGQSFFANMQENLRDIVRGLLALYVIFLGYKYMIERRGITQSDWIWIGLKLALVWYFAVGAGLTYFMPLFHQLSQGMAAIIIDAGQGSQLDEAALTNAYDQLRVAEIAYAAGSGTQASVDAADQTLDDLLASNLALGYNYCDYQSVDYTFPEPHPFADIDPGVSKIQDRDMSFMRLWDTLDCKLAKYLGIGDNPGSEAAPQVLLIGIAAIFANAGGFIIFFLTLIYLIFLIMVVLRILEVYLVSFLALSMFIYLGPIAIPSVLFQYTKGTFDTWLKSITAYVVQPLMLFSFVAFTFGLADHLIYGKNFAFYPVDWGDEATYSSDWNTEYSYLSSSQRKYQAKTDENRMKLINEGKDCVDPNTLGCIYRKINFATSNAEDARIDFKPNRVTTTEQQLAAWLLGLLKLVFFFFIISAAIEMIEQMSIQLSDATVDPTAGSKVKPDVMSIASKVGKGTGAAKDFGVRYVKDNLGIGKKKDGGDDAKDAKKGKTKRT